MRYSDETVNQVREASDIVSIVGERVKLTKKGANYFGLCPFHSEKTPSFSVNADKQIYHCFGCGAGGNVFSFLREYEGMSFVDALKYLADRAGITLPAPVEDSDQRALRSLKDQLIRIHLDSALYYHEVLKSDEGAEGLDYLLTRRGLRPHTITHFGLGVTPSSRDGLYRHLKSRGYTDEIIGDSGLVIYKETGVYDRFFRRVIFPIMDTQNHVIGFGGRVMGEGEPKYLNSPETPIFDKSQALYGINFARSTIRSRGAVICEGYLDTIALHEAGFVQAVATLGTALTEKHALALRRVTDTVYLCLDSDEAGVRAKIRAYPILRDAGLSVKVIRLEGAKDPDEYIRKFGPSQMEDRIRGAENGFLYSIDEIKKGYDLSDPAEKTAFYRETARRLAGFKDNLERLNYTEAVSRKCFIPLDELRKMTEELAAGESPLSVRTRPRANVPAKTDVSKYEELLAAWIIERPSLYEAVKRYIDISEFGSPLIRDIIGRAVSSDAKDSDKLLSSYAEDEEASREIAKICSRYSLEGLDENEIEKGLSEAVRRIKEARIDSQAALAGGDAVLLDRYLKEKNALSFLKVCLSS